MYTNPIPGRITGIQTKMNEKKAMAKAGQISVMSNTEFQIMCREINLEVITTVFGADIVTNKKGEYRLKFGLFGNYVPTTAQLLQIIRLQNDFYKEVTQGYSSPAKVQDSEDIGTYPPQDPKNIGSGCNLIRPEKITNESVMKMIEAGINKKLTGDDIHEMAAVAEELKKHNTFWKWLIGGSIIIALVGGAFVVKFIMDKKNGEDESLDIDNESSFNEMNDVDIDLDENPEVSIESNEAIPETLSAF